MSKRLLVEERVRARELFVHEHRSLADISVELGVHIVTLRRWVKKEGWMTMRREASTTPLEIGRRIRKILAQVLDQIDQKLEANEHISDRLLTRLDKYSRTLIRITDEGLDDRSIAVYGMGMYVRYIIDYNKDRTIVDILQKTLPDFYNLVSQGKIHAGTS